MRLTKETITVQQPVTKEVVTGVTVDLTLEEYATLRIILGKIGGSPSGSLRGYVQSLSEKLAMRTDRNGCSWDSPHDLCLTLTGSWEQHDALYNPQSRSIIFAEGSKTASIFHTVVDYYRNNLK